MSLYIVHDDDESYKYVVKASSHSEAIELVKQSTGHTKWGWIADLCDNDELIENKQNNKELIDAFTKKLKSKFGNKLYFEYSLNLSDINSIIDEVSKEMIQ